MAGDRVLQTLTLIQRHASDPVEVSKLADQQERELRSMINDGGVASYDSV